MRLNSLFKSVTFSPYAVPRVRVNVRSRAEGRLEAQLAREHGHHLGGGGADVVERVGVTVGRALLVSQEDVKGHDPTDEQPNVAHEEVEQTSLEKIAIPIPFDLQGCSNEESQGILISLTFGAKICRSIK